MHGIVDEKTDIFAFGVLLLEIVTGRRPIDCSKQSLLQWVSTGQKQKTRSPGNSIFPDMTCSSLSRQSHCWKLDR
jgi:hypothetical protein